MQKLISDDFSTAEEPESREQDMADDAEESGMEEWGRDRVPPTSVEGMTEDIKSTPLHKRTEVLSPAGLAEYRTKSPPTCKSHHEQLPA